MGKISGILTVRRRMNWQKYCKKLINLKYFACIFSENYLLLKVKQFKSEQLGGDHI